MAFGSCKDADWCKEKMGTGQAPEYGIVLSVLDSWDMHCRFTLVVQQTLCLLFRRSSSDLVVPPFLPACVLALRSPGRSIIRSVGCSIGSSIGSLDNLDLFATCDVVLFIREWWASGQEERLIWSVLFNEVVVLPYRFGGTRYVNCTCGRILLV